MLRLFALLTVFAVLAAEPALARMHKSPDYGDLQEMMTKPVPTDVTIEHSSPVKQAANANGQVAYITVRDGTGAAAHLKERVLTRMSALGFKITDKPSKADRIVDLEVISKRTAQAESMREAVRRGFGQNPHLRPGTDGVLIADVLLVRRNVPDSGKHGLRNAASRNATSMTRIRVGVAGRSEQLGSHDLEQALAADVAMLAASGRDLEAAGARKIDSPSMAHTQKNR